jgi:predicted Zn finger-like uncharacterized protein
MTTVTCPGCQAQLRVPESLLGRKAKCNKCATVIQVPAVAITERPPVPTRAAARVDDLNGAGDGRPAARTRRSEPQDDFVDDERPRRRSRRGDDEDFEEPRPRRSKKKKTSPALLIGLFGGLAVLLIGGGVGAFFLFRGGSAATSGANAMKDPNSPLRFMPDNAPLIMAFRLTDVRGSGAWKELKQEFPEIQDILQKEMGNEISLNDITSVHVGGDPNNKRFMIVIDSTRPIPISKLTAKNPFEKFQSKKVGAFEIQEARDLAMCLVDDGKRLLLGTPSELNAVLQRNGLPSYSSKVKAVLSDLNFSSAFVLAADVAAMPKNQFGGGLGGFGGPGKPGDVPESVGVEVQTAAKVKVRVIMEFKDAATAQAGKREFDASIPKLDALGGFVPGGQELINIVKNIKLDVNGAQLIASTEFSVGPVARSLKGLLGNLGPGPGKFPQPGPFPKPGPFPQPQPFPQPDPFKGPPNQPPVGFGGQVILNTQGNLTNLDPMDRVRRGRHQKVYLQRLQAGKTYQIDLRSDQFDSYLRLENPQNQQLAEDDDSGGFPHARIIFTAPRTDNYRIIVTSFAPGAGGVFNLTVREQ